jgi:YbbR domain-containing protein
MALRDYILDRFWLKLFSFILATLVWFTVQSNVQTDSGFATWNPFRPVETRTITRDVELTTLPTNRRSFGVKPAYVQILVRGYTADLNQLDITKVQPFVNLKDAPDGPGEFRIEIRNLPRNIRVQEIIPRMVTVEPVKAEGQ